MARRSRYLAVAVIVLMSAQVAAPASAAVSVSRAELSGSRLRIDGTALAGRDITVDGVVMARSSTSGTFRIERDPYSPPADCTVDLSDGSSTVTSARLSGCTVTQTPPPPSGDTTAPSAPTGLVASLSGTTANLSWTASTDNVGVTAYRIFRDGATTPIGTSTTTSFADTTVVPTTTYSYTVKAYDDAGNASPASNTVTTTTPAVGGGVLTFLPVADAYVDEASPTTNRGTSTQLRIDGSPNVHGYLKFDVQGVSQAPTSAVLRVFASSSSTTGHDVRGATDTSWTETGITYATRPAFGSVAGTSGAFTSGRYIEVPVTSLVTGNGLLTLVMTGPGATAISYASREVAANPPQLVVNTAP